MRHHLFHSFWGEEGEGPAGVWGTVHLAELRFLVHGLKEPEGSLTRGNQLTERPPPPHATQPGTLVSQPQPICQS